MSSENEDKTSPDKAPETFHESQKQSKISYTREFLLSLSELDICKKLPRGFDRSILGEFEDGTHGIQDWQRIPSSLSLQGFRRNDYGSSPPTRGDSSNYSRGIYGKWETRSSGRNDKDSDSQSDWESDSGRRYGNQLRRSWQSPEHDGLLGSGSFPRPSGYSAGMSAPRVRVDDQPQLNRTNELYHPPRPYKAVPHSRRETNDSYNDETFGSAECTSQDRAEEEERRRASFDLMRKEQHKVLQEKQKLNLDKCKDDLFSDVTVLLEQTKDEKRPLEGNNEMRGSTTVPISNNETSNSSLPSETHASRPLVPPGFTSIILEKNSGLKSLSINREIEIGKPEIDVSLLLAKATPVQNGTLDNQEERQSVYQMGLSEQQPENKSIHGAFLNTGEKMVNSSPGLEVSKKQLGLDDHLYRTSSISQAHEALDNGEIIELTNAKVMTNKINTDSKQDNSKSILEKLFSSALTVNIGGPSGVIEHRASIPDDMWSPNTVQSSKFAHWFLEDEKKPADDLSSGRLGDMLSLFVSGEKGGSQISDLKATQHIPPEFSYQSAELTNSLTSNIPPAKTGISEQLYNYNKQEAVPAVLTCEDLEQTILSEYKENSSTLRPPLQDSSVSGAKTMQPKENIDNHASQHLLSLLQKGIGLKDMIMTSSSNIDIGSSNKLYASKVGYIGTVLDKPREANAENIQDSGRSITLETLFGTAFMKELQSVEAPVSVHRGLVGSARTDVFEPHGLSFPPIDGGLFPSTTDEIGSNGRHLETNVLALNQKERTNLDKIENWLGFDEPQIEMESSKFRTEVVPKHGVFDVAVEIQLPEEESLITVGDPVNPRNPIFTPAGNSTKGEFLSSNKPIDIAEQLAALNAGFKDERSMVAQEGTTFVRGPYGLMESERQYNLHAQPSSPRFHSSQMSHGRPLFHPLDSHPAHINSQMKFMAPESIIQHDTPPNNQFPASMLHPPFHHPNEGLTGFDLPAHHQMVQQMQMTGNFPPPHLLREFPRGPPLPPHPSNQATNFMQEPNLMQGYPFGHRQANVGGLGMPQRGPDVSSGSNHPESFQRLMGWNLANSKQIHPFGVGHSQGMYGHELDMGFRYR